MKACWNGAGCRVPGCLHPHPPGAPAVYPVPHDCRWGAACAAYACRFAHPPERARMLVRAVVVVAVPPPPPPQPSFQPQARLS